MKTIKQVKQDNPEMIKPNNRLSETAPRKEIKYNYYEHEEQTDGTGAVMLLSYAFIIGIFIILYIALIW